MQLSSPSTAQLYFREATCHTSGLLKAAEGLFFAQVERNNFKGALQEEIRELQKAHRILMLQVEETEKTCTTPYEFLTIAYSETFFAVGYSKSKKDAEQIAAASLAEKIASKFKQVSQYVHVTRETVKKARSADF